MAAFSAGSELVETSGLASSAESAAGFGELQEDGGEKRRGSAAGLCGVLAAGSGPPGVHGAPSASSSTVSELNCRERSPDVDSSIEDSSVSGTGARGALWRVIPSSPFMVSTMTPHDRPKYVKEMMFPGKMIFPAGNGEKEKRASIYRPVKTNP